MIKKVAIRYWELIDRFREKPSGDIPYAIFPDYLGTISPEYVYVSYRHYTCLAYLVFFQERTPESVVLLHDAVVQWRKKAKKYRPERTLIEVVARRSYLRYKKWFKKAVIARMGQANSGKKQGKAAKKNKTGIHHPSITSEMHAEAKKKWHEVVKRTGGYDYGFWWLITCPDGRKVKTNLVNDFCIKEGILVKSLKRHGKVAGYTLERAEPPHPNWMILPYKDNNGYDPLL